MDELNDISTNGSSEHRGKRDRAHDLVCTLHRVHRNDRTSSLDTSDNIHTPPTILFCIIEVLFQINGFLTCSVISHYQGRTVSYQQTTQFSSKLPSDDISTHSMLSHFICLRFHTSSNTSCATSRNETHLLSGTSASATSGRLTNVLVVTSSMRMIHRIHAHTAHLRPLIALHSELVVRTTRLQHRLVHAASSSNDTHHTTTADS